MAKRKTIKKAAPAKVSKNTKFIEYNSLTFLLFLAFVLLVSLLLVSKVFAAY